MRCKIILHIYSLLVFPSQCNNNCNNGIPLNSTADSISSSCSKFAWKLFTFYRIHNLLSFPKYIWSFINDFFSRTPFKHTSHNTGSITKCCFSPSDFCFSNGNSNITPQYKAILGVDGQVSAMEGYRSGFCEKKPNKLIHTQIVSGNSNGPMQGTSKPSSQDGVIYGKPFLRNDKSDGQAEEERKKIPTH